MSSEVEIIRVKAIPTDEAFSRFARKFNSLAFFMHFLNEKSKKIKIKHR